MPTSLREARPGRTFIGRLPTDADLTGEIERFCADHDIRAAWVSCVGAVQHLEYAFYDQRALRYLDRSSDAHHELAGFVGNISLRDGTPFLHAHASFGDDQGGTVTGHLRAGTIVWVAEVQIQELADVDLIREHDERTGLALW